MFSPALLERAQHVSAACRAKGLHLAAAESCTGGLILGCLTAIAGSSDVVERGFVVYTNEAKTELLGVPEGLFAEVGAVSEDVARAMAEGALAHAPAEVAVSCTGIAGPGGGTAEKPVGLVHLAVAQRGAATLHRRCTYGDIGRDAVRLAAVADALDLVLEGLEAH